jgi:peptidoglycan hydrolase-like protein with peptidoglycan-binding domain
MKKFVISVVALMAMATASALAQGSPVPAGDLNMDAVPSLDRDGVRQVQTLLKQRGFDPGPIDGVEGPLTSGAIRGFQERYGIKTAGAIDNETLFALGAQSLAGAAGR